MGELSIIIPVLNEEDSLGSLLVDLQNQSGINLEIIIVDGGSNDRTVEIGQSFGVICLETQARRSVQCNYGARYANFQHLLFLHADTRLEGTEILNNSLQYFTNNTPTALAAHFSLSFRHSKQPIPRAYSFYQAKTELSRKNCNNGDQGLLISKQVFWGFEGYNSNLSILEDQDLIERIRAKGPVVALPYRISTSARRFESEGFAARMILSAIIVGLHEADCSEIIAAIKDAYRAQSQTSKLELLPLFLAVHRATLTVPLLERGRKWLRVGAFVKVQLWQLVLLATLPFDSSGIVCKKQVMVYYDRFIAPLMNFRIFTLIATLLTISWFYGNWAILLLREKATIFLRRTSETTPERKAR